MTKTIKKWNRLYEGKLISEMKNKEMFENITKVHDDDLRFRHH
jgi:hypothetical protein